MESISLTSLAIMLIPLGIVGGFYWKWVGLVREIPIATLRMATQLLLVGYLLTWLFNQNRLDVALVVMVVMILASTLIARRNHDRKTTANFWRILVAISLGGSINLVLVVGVVVRPEPVYSLSTLIPLSGMIFSNGMNAVSLAGERFWKSVERGSDYQSARNEAFKMSLIPQINSFLAVGLVALPGMMTGQVLSGVSPLIAVRYQIMVMAMVMGTAGLSVILYLSMCRRCPVFDVKSEGEG
jgi:putative ABC transport system permease protein